MLLHLLSNNKDRPNLDNVLQWNTVLLFKARKKFWMETSPDCETKKKIIFKLGEKTQSSREQTKASDRNKFRNSYGYYQARLYCFLILLDVQCKIVIVDPSQNRIVFLRCGFVTSKYHKAKSFTHDQKKNRTIRINFDTTRKG